MREGSFDVAEIPLKTWPESFEAVVQGRKTHEWRKDDRVPPFAIGDVLMLREFFPCELCKGTGRARCGAAEVCCPEPHGKFSGREHKVYVNFITRGEFGVPDGWICMSIGRDYIPPPARDPRADPKPGDRVQSVGGRETCYVLEVFWDPRISPRGLAAQAARDLTNCRAAGVECRARRKEGAVPKSDMSDACVGPGCFNSATVMIVPHGKWKNIKPKLACQKCAPGMAAAYKTEPSAAVAGWADVHRLTRGASSSVGK